MNSYTKSYMGFLKKMFRIGFPISQEDVLILSEVLKIDLTSNNYGECSICFKKMDRTNYMDLQCNHIFHRNCIRVWIKSKKGKVSCPLCRRESTSLDLNEKKYFDKAYWWGDYSDGSDGEEGGD